MKKSRLAFLWTLAAGVAGIYVGAMLNLEGYLGVILSVATMGAFVISAIGGKEQ